jgi:uncharacterized protein YjbI with pentapeptide repeats
MRHTAASRERRAPELASEPALVHEWIEGRRFEDCQAAGLDLAGREIRGLTARGSWFERVSFAQCVLPALRLRDVRLVRCDFSNVTARGFEGTRVEFIDCRLIGLKAIECRWQDVLIENCDVRYSQFNDAVLRDCEFKTSQCQESDFRGADLEGSRFAQVSWQRADLTGARLKGIDLRGADIEGWVLRAEDVFGAIVSPVQAMDLARLLGLVIR